MIRQSTESKRTCHKSPLFNVLHTCLNLVCKTVLFSVSTGMEQRYLNTLRCCCFLKDDIRPQCQISNDKAFHMLVVESGKKEKIVWRDLFLQTELIYRLVSLVYNEHNVQT